MQSEVRRILERIDAEAKAANSALHDSALGTAKHGFITARMENIGRCGEELAAIIDPEAAKLLVLDHLNTAIGSPPQSQEG